VRVEGFEPPTAWFVARYSIQLSYTRIKLFIASKLDLKGYSHIVAFSSN
jgi:hypothetical protein